MAPKKPKLILISGTAARIIDFKRSGFYNRQRKLIAEYAKHFDIEYFTSDITDYSSELQIKHHPLPVKTDIYGLRHLLFWLYLVLRARFMRGPIRVFGLAMPTLPLLKLLSGQKVIVGYQWDYASTTKANYKGIKRLLAGSIQNLGFKGADLAVCTTSWLKENAENKYHKPAIVIPNFVDTEMFRRETTKEDYILYAGRLHWTKGVEYLIKAFSLLKQEFSNVRLVICGEGDYLEALVLIVKKNNLDNVRFTGTVRQETLAHLMGQAKIFVLPTLTSEGHPKALIEAMACGTACIATDVPGNRNVITHSENGLLVSPEDINGLYQALTLLITDKDFRTKLEQNAYLFASTNYNIESTLRKEIALLNHWNQKDRIN